MCVGPGREEAAEERYSQGYLSSVFLFVYADTVERKIEIPRRGPHGRRVQVKRPLAGNPVPENEWIDVHDEGPVDEG